MHGAGGRRGAFLAAAAAVSLRCSPATEIVCSHLHLAPAAALQAWRGARVTAVLCGIEAWVPLRKPEAWALERADLVAISQHTVDAVQERQPGVRVDGRGGVSSGPARRLPARPGRARAGRGSPALIVARMSADERYKGHDELLDVWPALLARKPDARLVVAGDGTDRPRLESRAASLGLSHAVTFVGRVGDDELAALYEQCRFLVMPSRDEGFGLVFLEAMRAGKAVRRRERRGRRNHPPRRDRPDRRTGQAGRSGGRRVHAVRRAGDVPSIRRRRAGALSVDVYRCLLSSAVCAGARTPPARALTRHEHSRPERLPR